MHPITVAVHGLGNIGRHVIDSLCAAPDFSCLGVIRRATSLGTRQHELRGIQEFSSLDRLVAQKGKPDVAILCNPSRAVPETALEYLAMGIRTVDSFDIHSEISSLVQQIEPVVKKTGSAAIIAAGWDPGTDSVIRALFEAMTPVGTTFTNFGRGRSMGHSAAARAITGVADAISITIPSGGGRHARLVYLLLEEGTDFAAVKAELAKDPYFAHDPLDVRLVFSAAEMASVADNSHGVFMERVGAAGSASNQRLTFDMRIDNPALTAQVLVSCARAVTRMPSGCYTLIDVPPVALLPGERMEHIRRLV